MSLFSYYVETLKFVSIGQNSAYDYLKALLVFVVFIAVLKLIQVIILAHLKQIVEKTKTDLDDVLIKIFKEVKPPFYFFIALYFAIKALTFPQLLSQVIYVLFLVLIIYEVVRALEKLVDFAVEKYIAKTKNNEADIQHTQSMMKTIKVILKVTLWILGITMVLANLGVNVTSIVASLGIGGIAIALALQNILGDIFSSFSIYMDKPFQVGDFIVVGTDMGTVEKIGLKTTRIRTPQGEELIISNKELTTTRVQNFKRMERRRALFSIGVVYGTKLEKLKKIPEMIEEIVKKNPSAEFDRCHFKSYGDFSLNFEVVYYVTSADYKQYMDVNHQINLEIYKRFEEEAIEFAYPTQTVFLNK